MAEEKSFLQTIKLEISKSFKLLPYERIAFHKILGILKSDAGTAILLKELDRGPDIRENAVTVLAEFDNPQATTALIELLAHDISPNEKLKILNHIETFGSKQNIGALIEFINREIENKESHNSLKKAFNALKKIGSGNEEALNYLLSIVSVDAYSPEVISMAVYALSSFRVVSTFETLLKRENDMISSAVYASLYILSTELIDSTTTVEDEESKLYTYSPDSEDKIILDIRVLLGKMSFRFDSYTNSVKVAYISSMMSCNHREYLIYVMKALTSGNSELVTMTLYIIYDNIQRLRDPDKLFRSLISLSTESDKDNELIVAIFEKYFSMPNETRQFHILKDKLYNYIVVTLETYFETFRKEFMITEVVEKSYPENFQRIRRFILSRFTPELKKTVLTFLSGEESPIVQHIITDMSKWIKHVDEDENRDLSLLLEVLADQDKKSRDVSASRIEGINFEKRYLRTRIIRLFGIISKLSIHEAASPLVNIYNYLKKYPEPEILEATIRTLSILNYSYMLGEIEVQINTASYEEQKKAMSLLGLYYEQRSLNLLFEFLQRNMNETGEIVRDALLNLNNRDIIGNISAAQILKAMIENNQSSEIRGLAILALGKCGFEADIEYLNEFFYKMKPDEPKDVVVRAIGNIITLNENFNRRLVIKYLQEYLKDPGIKVRIDSCLILAKLGNNDAIRSIRDMLIIKNKGIQRDILTILGDLKSLEFSFFLISLLKEDYGITEDIIPVIRMLPIEDLKEIDGFVVNIFRKFEAPDIQSLPDHEKGKSIITVTGLKESTVTFLNIDLYELSSITQHSISDLISLNITVKSILVESIKRCHGIICRMSNKGVTSYFPSAAKAAEAALEAKAELSSYNKNVQPDRSFNVFLQIITDNIKILNEEILIPPLNRFSRLTNLSFLNKILCDEATFNMLHNEFSGVIIPDIVLMKSGCIFKYFDLGKTNNFLRTAQDIYSKIMEEETVKQKLQEQIESEIKRMKMQSRPASSIAITRELEDIGNKMKTLLDEVDRYIQRRSTDRELIRNAHRMLTNIYDMYKVEITRIILK